MKKYSVVYHSKTGNTELLANAIKEILSEIDIIYYGAPKTEAMEASVIFLGFWTDKGESDKISTAFLKTLHNKKIFLFGTAGFGGNDEYFSQILSRVKLHLDDSNVVIGTYMCQGKMPMIVRNRYESMLSNDSEKMIGLIENFDRALSHPDNTDLEHLQQIVTRIIDSE